jgi:hypothetical protein
MGQAYSGIGCGKVVVMDKMMTEESSRTGRARTRDAIERYIRDLEAIKNYDKVKKERDDALKKADPIELLKTIVNELGKPEAERVFPLNVTESGIVEKIEAIIDGRSEHQKFVDRWFEENIKTK